GGMAWDNLARFAFLSRGALQLCRHLRFVPDVFHAHDWPTAMVPLYLNTVEARGEFARAASVLTLHNVAHQARFPAWDWPATHLPWDVFNEHGVEDHRAV